MILKKYWNIPDKSLILIILVINDDKVDRISYTESQEQLERSDRISKRGLTVGQHFIKDGLSYSCC